jgi:hypothetical protein
MDITVFWSVGRSRTISLIIYVFVFMLWMYHEIGVETIAGEVNWHTAEFNF